LDKSTRDKVTQLKEKISKLAVDFSKNCNEESTKLTFSAEQLKGLNEHLSQSLPKDESGNFIVSLKYPVYFPVMKECQVAETRKQLNIAFDKRCVKENTAIFEEILELRSELAHILGFKNYSEYALATLCAKNPQNVQDFLGKLGEKMKVLQKKGNAKSARVQETRVRGNEVAV
jgi:thimet oligopeptidase